MKMSQKNFSNTKENLLFYCFINVEAPFLLRYSRDPNKTLFDTSQHPLLYIILPTLHFSTFINANVQYVVS